MKEREREKKKSVQAYSIIYQFKSIIWENLTMKWDGEGLLKENKIIKEGEGEIGGGEGEKKKKKKKKKKFQRNKSK